MKYSARTTKGHWPKRFIWTGVIVLVGLALATVAVQYVYRQNLEAVNKRDTTTQTVTVERGASVKGIAKQLKDAGLIRSTWAFEWYVNSKEVRNALQAGSYMFSSSQTIPEIVSQLTHGKIVTDLLTILPAQRLDQLRQIFERFGYSREEIDHALDSRTYLDHPALVDKPAGVGLEGYLYPDSFQKTANTPLSSIVALSLDEMSERLTPELRAAFADQGLSTYQGIILASIVEQEVSNPHDRAQAAQVFLKRLRAGIPLGADPTATYGAIAAGQKPSFAYDSPYNTHLHAGLPPTPISNVSNSSLQAVAHPASTDWLFFVAGDDGKTYFSRTLQEHEALTQQYCHRLCQ